ncbi:hypothetical protein HMI54_003486 [Coelomomyces lativittatus]|nr:hypothetical protein HMI54_003486 [Coelomomyces lativittatus]KAJ1513937.1 hypothetical protein HMI56_001476 [Coelomomyces lativittatus]KAJ1518152.1 hypothetical protein HMI55_002401 [Coelomomyces lativittatus]
MSKELEKLSISLSSQPNGISSSTVPLRSPTSVRSTLVSSILNSIQQCYNKSIAMLSSYAHYFQHHERNLQIICLVQVVSNTAFSLDAFLNLRSYDSLALSNGLNKWNLNSVSIQCTWIWLLHGIFFVLVSCTYISAKYHGTLVYPIVFLCVLVSIILMLVAGTYYLIYESLWIRGTMECKDSTCSEAFAVRDYSAHWSLRTLSYIILQWFLIHPMVSYFIVLLKERNEVTKVET